MQFQDYIARQIKWSLRTFGSGKRTKGLTAHIRKELEEIERAPGDIEEWIDVIILGIDGAWRAGASEEYIAHVLQQKQDKNLARKWPAPKSEDEPVEHIRD